MARGDFDPGRHHGGREAPGPLGAVALLSTPWPLFDRPSIQLGALKAYLRQELPNQEVLTFPLYLPVAATLGYALYRPISQGTWIGESLYAALLYPERREILDRFFRRRAASEKGLRAQSFGDLLTRLEAISREIFEGIPWESFLLAGFSVCLGQLLSSLYFLHQARVRAPGLRILLGGSSCAGDMGRSLLDTFPAVDYVITGEGERPLTALVAALTGPGGPRTPISGLPGLLARDSGQGHAGPDQVLDLDALPIPDFGDYFRDLTALPPEKRFFPRLPMEISRGCWWRSGPRGGCAFCNLNLQWNGYRAKGEERIVREVRALSDTHKTLSLSFMDNLLPARGLGPLFRRLQGLCRDFRLFCELRASVSEELLGILAGAGVRQVQVGIESLSTGLLKRLNKGTRVIDNLAVMRACEIPGYPTLNANLILGFPGSGPREVEETLKTLAFSLPFRPLTPVQFWLGYGSPVWQSPKDYGIVRTGNHPFSHLLFPPEICARLLLMAQGYRGGLREQARLWAPVRQRLRAWERHYLACHRTPGAGPILSYSDAGDFLIIRERRPGGLDQAHRLTRTSREIYLFCTKPRSLKEILTTFPSFTEDRIRPFLGDLTEKRVMFEEGDRYLSLAVPVLPFCRGRGSPGGD